MAYHPSSKKRELTAAQRAIVIDKGTEPPFTGIYLHNKEQGRYACVVCGRDLFASDTKFESGTGWPSFWDMAGTDTVQLKPDNSHGMQRIEAVCRNCGAHLGHVFDDGPAPSGKRYCINSLALDFTAGEKE